MDLFTRRCPINIGYLDMRCSRVGGSIFQILTWRHSFPVKVKPVFSLNYFKMSVLENPEKRKVEEPIANAPKKTKQQCLDKFFTAKPKIQPKAPVSNANIISDGNKIKFDKKKWAEELTDDQRKLLQLEIDTMEDSWFEALKDEFLQPYFLNLKQFLQSEWQGERIFPPKEDIYSWSHHTPLSKVRVIILGQDPYHNVGQAHGLCFSVRPGIPCPPSLMNIYKAIKVDYEDFVIPKSGYLIPWADQGVLMLNASLTVRAHQAASHSGKGWERFTSAALQIALNKHKRGIVVLAWGTPANKRLQGLPLQSHCVLKSVHPSPLSAHRGFFECHHFKKTNEWLAERYGAENSINWHAVSLPTPSKSASMNKPLGNTVEGSSLMAEKIKQEEQKA
ncbi:uracil DNA N-glycosylase Ung1 [Schizosaccharomyces cryophilus OY26]|uniref:Uracil-DNA glycosylase n=1 Tax=Schizosaccharomyces cryophilus (strain OY26 / ATCC MYA-4695 / CBS 11777 / NBRC 106824 / NRRL Y48691) TaxID=653667 RepID=S9VPP2_SCHCR|nr:uracil DNA N-glycosylase Ung1 [Schizosaccharomyces cryophilus OY26]EPY49903.1 uracil DNA N-glycosylase Ung1 [Schizosaccharomyces cryophilus OY26]